MSMPWVKDYPNQEDLLMSFPLEEFSPVSKSSEGICSKEKNMEVADFFKTEHGIALLPGSSSTIFSKAS